MAAGDVAVSIQSATAKKGCMILKVNTKVAIPSSVINSTVFSISFWEYSLGPNNEGYIMCDENNFANLFLRRSGEGLTIDGQIGNIVFGVSAFELPRQVWNHIVLTHDAAGNFKVYANNLLKLELAGSNFAGLDNDLWLGNRHALDRDFLGGISDLRIYDKVLDTTEINSLFLKQNLLTNLIHKYDFLDDSYDDSIGSADGTNTGTYIGILESSVTAALVAGRTASNDTFFMTESANNQIITVVIDES